MFVIEVNYKEWKKEREKKLDQTITFLYLSLSVEETIFERIFGNIY